MLYVVKIRRGSYTDKPYKTFGITIETDNPAPPDCTPVAEEL